MEHDEPREHHNPIVRGTLVGAEDPGLKDPHTGDRLRVLKVLVLEDHCAHLWYDQRVLVQADE